MNLTLERVALIAGVVVLTASLQFGFGLAGAPAALVGALLLGVGATLMWLRFDLPATLPWLPPLLISLSVLLSTLILELTVRPVLGEWFAVFAAALGSAGTMYFFLRNRVRCNLCNRSLGSQALIFRCPRCSQEVCEETCWSFEHRRCGLCVEQRVSILPLEASWWNRVTGPQVKEGRCLICRTSADQADLRACPNCRRMQCRSCWDFNNGECSRCATPLPNLPLSLKTVLPGHFLQ